MEIFLYNFGMMQQSLSFIKLVKCIKPVLRPILQDPARFENEIGNVASTIYLFTVIMVAAMAATTMIIIITSLIKSGYSSPQGWHQVG